ncbi:hypothetical protein [Lentzea albidocapillata]|uniref:Uncharacterized protein n=1 Tax=Lentzea albidocapillata TaxID=40571 RepID=A0A1W2CKI0_9PSEU|nr:hypothetical protein [Lentzea albidocapillata]SMC85747.1 hypothetical protein SAMN05660733_02159 [Lentzea albidocapillata]
MDSTHTTGSNLSKVGRENGLSADLKYAVLHMHAGVEVLAKYRRAGASEAGVVPFVERDAVEPFDAPVFVKLQQEVGCQA